MAGVTILMPVLNGARHLDVQLASLAGQSPRPAGLIVSDDGSGDGSRAIIARFAACSPFPVVMRSGPGRGATANALSLLATAPDGPLALADQDDLWLPHRLADGTAALRGIREPAIATAPRIVTDAALNRRAQTGWSTGSATFANALLENLAPGNTMTLNAAAARLARDALRSGAPDPAHHDWWLSQIVLGAGGRIVRQPRPGLCYRQHGQNLFGAACGAAALAGRLIAVLDGTYGQWVRRQALALWQGRHLLTQENRRQLQAFLSRRDRPWEWWAAGALPLGIPYRQSRAQTLVLQAAARAGRF